MILGFGQGWIDRLEFLQNCLILQRGSAQKCRCGTRECGRKQGTLGVPNRTNAKRIPLWLRYKRQSPSTLSSRSSLFYRNKTVPNYSIIQL